MSSATAAAKGLQSHSDSIEAASVASHDKEHGIDGELEDSPANARTLRKLVRRVDWLLMPPLLLLFGFQYADKAVLGSAAVAGILKDLQLAVPVPGSSPPVSDTTRYSTATALFYAGYAISVLPSALLAARFARHRILFLGGCVITWGAIVLLTPAVTTYRGLYVQRFFLGAVEATVSPGFVLLTRAWYLPREHASRLGIWYSATGLFSIFSGLVNFGLSSINSQIASWKVLYIFAGAFTILFGVLFLLLVPASPESPAPVTIHGYNGFSAHEAALLRQRILRGFPAPGSAENERWTSALRACVVDAKIHLYFAMAFLLYLTNGAVTAYTSLMIKNIYGYSGAHAIALQAPGGAATALSIYAVGYASLKIPNSRIALLCLGCIPVIVGALMLWLGPWANRGVVLAGLYLLPIFGAPFVMLLSLATANTRGPLRSAIASGWIFIAYALSNIAAPYTFHSTELGVKYRTTWITIISAQSATIGLAAALALIMYLANRRHQRKQLAGTTQASGFKYVF